MSESQACEAAQHRAQEGAAPCTHFVAGLTADTQISRAIASREHAKNSTEKEPRDDPEGYCDR